jgi:gliding motility-associated-like protein
LKDKDYIKDLFSEKLSNLEVPVRSDLWSGIQSQIGNTATSTVVAKGISSSLKWMIGIASSVAVIGTTVWIASSPETSKEQKQVFIAENNGNEELKKETKNGVKLGVTNRLDRGANAIQTEPIVPQVELPSNNYLDEWISRERQQYNIDNLNKQITPPADENRGVVDNTGITEPVNSASNTNVTPDPIETKTYEDGKIEEFFNVFTPNGDGMNDYFFLKSENLKDFTIRIFNERNEFVFQSTDKDFKWFGLDPAGNMVEPGNYGYVIFATDLNGKSIKMFKSLTIK